MNKNKTLYTKLSTNHYKTHFSLDLGTLNILILPLS